MGISLLFLAARIGSDVMSHVRSNDHHAPLIGWPAFVVLLGTLAVNLGVSIYQTRLGRALGSSLLESDGKHTRADCYVTAGVLVATTLSWAGFPAFDLPAAAIVVVLIAMAGFDILATNAPYLTDAALVAPERIRRAVGRVVAAESVHAIRTRGTPDAVFVDLRVRLGATLSVREADAIVGDLVSAIRGEIEAVADVVVQVECDRGG
jgi:cation diffusion facilitator family transporter